MSNTLTFVTNNAHKFAEAQKVVGQWTNLLQTSIDLDEIQAIEVEEVIRHKLAQAYEGVGQPVICEDTALYIDMLNGFPGALIKWYLERLEVEGIARLHGGSPAHVKTVVGYHDGQKMHFFAGRTEGKIASEPQGEGFGWSAVFVPEIPGKENKRSFAEMTQEEKLLISMRGKAFRQLAQHLAKTTLNEAAPLEGGKNNR
ncbi:MAG: non-canonical purine NTP pyrophosphatase [Bacteroidota bacterium]